MERISHCGQQTSVYLKGKVKKGGREMRSARSCFTQACNRTTVSILHLKSIHISLC